jgi:hypothetical protein
MRPGFGRPNARVIFSSRTDWDGRVVRQTWGLGPYFVWQARQGCRKQFSGCGLSRSRRRPRSPASRVATRDGPGRRILVLVGDGHTSRLIHREAVETDPDAHRPRPLFWLVDSGHFRRFPRGDPNHATHSQLYPRSIARHSTGELRSRAVFHAGHFVWQSRHGPSRDAGLESEQA